MCGASRTGPWIVSGFHRPAALAEMPDRDLDAELAALAGRTEMHDLMDHAWAGQNHPSKPDNARA